MIVPAPRPARAQPARVGTKAYLAVGTGTLASTSSTTPSRLTPHAGVVAQDQTVGQHGPGQGLDVVGDHVVPPGRAARTRAAQDRQRGPRRHADGQRRVAAAGVGQVHQVALQRGRHVDGCGPDEPDHVGPGDDGLELGGHAMGVEDLELGLSIGVPEVARSRKRSSWLSGIPYVPSCSTGFCVAITRKGRSSG